MDLQEIQNKINSLLSDSERKIVFWYDDEGSYADDIGIIELEEGVNVHNVRSAGTEKNLLGKI